MGRRDKTPDLLFDPKPRRRKRKRLRWVGRLLLLAGIGALAFVGYERFVDDAPALDEPRTLGGPQGEARRVGDYDITPTITLDATERLREMSVFNGPPSHGRFALVELEVTYVGEDEGDPAWDLEVALRGANGLTYEDIGCLAVLDAPLNMELPKMAPGSTLTVTECLDYAPAAAEGGGLVVTAGGPADATSEEWPLG